MTLRVLIADDEPLARSRLRRLLADHADVHVIAECEDGVSAVNLIERESPDLILLDVEMPELDGFGVLKALDPADWPGVIFVSAFDHYAIRAFEVHALDYVVKPVEAGRFDEALAHARTRLTERRRAEADPRLLQLLEHSPGRTRYLTRVPVRSQGRLILIDLVDVDWIGAADNYAILHAGGREYIIRDTLTRLERDLDPEQFVRIHRSAIIQIARIADLTPDFHGDFSVRLKTGASLTLSRTFRARVERALGRRL